MKHALAAVFSVVIIPSLAFGARDTSSCQFEGSLKELSNVQSSSGDHTENIRAELKIRKDILRNVISCAITEAQNLTAKLTSLNSGSADADATKARFVDNLNEVLDYYRSQKAKIDDLGIRGSEDLARTIKQWRVGIYAPLSDQTINFILWFKNQELIRTARNRLDQIGRTMRILKLMDNDDIKSLYDTASVSLSLTERLNSETKLALLEFGTSEDALRLIKSSLDALRKTYQTFFDLSDKVQKIIPR